MRLGQAARCLAVVVAATAGLAGAVALGWSTALPLVRGGARTFDDLLVGGCSVAAVSAAGWLWAATVLTATDAARGALRAVDRRGVPRALRGVVLLACGVAALGPQGPAAADSTSASSIPAPPVEHAPSTAAWMADALTSVPSTARRPAVDTVVVRPGDNLWALAASTLPDTAADHEVAAHSRRLHDLNRAVIGDDPDLIHPGQRLRLPPAPQKGAI